MAPKPPRAGTSVPDEIFAALVVLVVAEAAKALPLVFVTTVQAALMSPPHAVIPPLFAAPPLKLCACTDGAMPAKKTTSRSRMMSVLIGKQLPNQPKRRW